MATVTLGNIKFNWKGPYNNATAYVVDDVVSSGGSSYVCILASTGNAVSNGTYWQQMSAAGTDGTDVAATLANKEISFKTNAGALDGIPIGNAGEFLKVNSGATGYEFGAVSSDFVKLASTNVTTDTTTIDFLSIFTSSYEFYKIYLSVFAGSTGSNINFRAITGTNTVDDNGGSYFQLGDQTRISTAGSNDSPANYGSHNHGEVYLTYPAGIAPGTGQDYGAFATIEIGRPWDASNSKWGHLKNIYRDNGGKITLAQGGFVYRPNTAMTGFRIYSSTFNRGRVSVYGMKH